MKTFEIHDGTITTKVKEKVEIVYHNKKNRNPLRT